VSDDDWWAFGEFIKRLRTDRGLNREQLSERSDVAVDTIRRIERGAGLPNLRTMRKLALGLGMRLSEIFVEYER
jgi:transcriptional regulator with XRE-family HTH domain